MDINDCQPLPDPVHVKWSTDRGRYVLDSKGFAVPLNIWSRYDEAVEEYDEALIDIESCLLEECPAEEEECLEI